MPYEIREGWPHVFGRPLFGGDGRTLDDVIEALALENRVSTLVTPNVDQLLVAERDPRARACIVEADVLLADGAPLVMLSRMLSAGVPMRLTGADLLPAVARASMHSGHRVAILGGGPGISERAAQNLRDAYPGADVRAVSFPQSYERTAAVERDVVMALVELQPHIVFVCLGFPRQEQWVRRWRRELPPAVYIGAGAAVDFAAGTARRAPRLLQRVGGEWLWRLMSEPSRLAGRYLIRGPRFVSIACAARRARTRMK